MRKVAKIGYSGLKKRDAQIKLAETGTVMDEMGAMWVDVVRTELARGDKNATYNLSDSYKTDVKAKGTEVQLLLYAIDYSAFVEKGVKGAVVDRAPDSPFKFGTGTGPAGGLRPAIRKWIEDKPLTNETWRSETGRFLSYDEMAAKIARSVFLRGIVPFPHIEPAMRAVMKRYKKGLSVALANDFASFMNGKDYLTDFDITLEI